jgi:hypothetical protein
MEREFSLSKRWKNWMTIEDEKRCWECEKYHGKIYAITEKPKPRPPRHLWCRCKIVAMRALSAGTATDMGVQGADWVLKHYNKLPEYYITTKEAKELGWKQKKGNLAEVAPGCMITREYYNKEGILPDKPGRIWQEADINYVSGKRNGERIFFSNDGLIFVSFDHGKTFIEIR